jgi:signal transduction histidine kinase
MIVARTLNNNRWLGKRPAPDLYTTSRQALEAAYRSIGLEGQRFYTAHRRSMQWGWTIATGVPRESVEHAMRGSVLTMIGGSLSAVSLALVLAFIFGRRISAPISAVAESAKALGAGSAVNLPSVRNIAEVSDVTRAFEEAGVLLRDRESALNLALTCEQQARAEAEAANRNKDEFLAMLGHELRNPLNAIVSAVAILDRIGISSESASIPREVITRQVRRLTKLVDDLLDVARVTSGKIVLEPRPVNLASTVQQSVAVLEETGRLANHRLDIDCAAVWTVADEIRLHQVVANLVENSVKYTPSGGEITVRTFPQNGDAVLEVSDTGAGISPDLLPRVFDLFAQGKRTMDRSQGGLGLGLTLVRRLVELHGGCIAASSEGVGKGAKFTIRVPRTDPPQADAVPRAVTTTPGRSLQVLVVDDNADGREMLKTVLVMQGHNVDEAEDGITAVERALESCFDVAIIDIGLPGFDGYEVARRIRAGSNGNVAKLIALTGYGQEEDRRLALAAGFDEHLVKPVDPDVLSKLFASL